MLALLFDIHGNLPALEAVLDDARAVGARRYLLGGDYAVFGGWQPETMARLRELQDATWIRGNVDRWAASHVPEPEPAHSGVLASRELLDAATIAALGTLPESADLGHGTRAWHASPKSDLASFWPEPGDDELELLEGVVDRRLVFGHFHLSFDRIGAHEIELVAPGAVGIPLDGDHRAAWALMHDDGSIERRRVAYDHAASAARVREVADGAPWGDVVAGRIERAGVA
jgi:diadenosine tetraphosphatase ApaH/serine/threonine PP2A family protein phosphatase